MEQDSLDAIAAEMQQLTAALSKLTIRLDRLTSETRSEQMEIEKEEKVSKATASQYELIAKKFIDECIMRHRSITGTWVMNFQASTETNEVDRRGRKKKAKIDILLTNADQDTPRRVVLDVKNYKNSYIGKDVIEKLGRDILAFKAEIGVLFLSATTKISDATLEYISEFHPNVLVFHWTVPNSAKETDEARAVRFAQLLKNCFNK